MKNIYLTLFFALLVVVSYGQEEELIPGAVVGSCIEPDSNLITIFFDYSKNCPQADPNGHLAGAEQLGFHSGINMWSTIVAFDDPNAMTMANLGNDVYTVRINTMEYYGAPLSEIETIHFLMRDADSSVEWDAGACRDDQGGGGFGGNEPCNDFEIAIANLPTCSELAQESSVSLFGATTSASSCVDTVNGAVTIEFDLSLNCPEADPNNVLAGAAELGFHSGINDWEVQVDWDSEVAMTAVNNGSDVFTVTVNTSEYYGVPLSDIDNIKMVMNNGIADPDNAFDAAGRDERDGGFGGTEPCTDLIILLDEAPACPVEVDTMPEPMESATSAALLSAEGDVSTCVDPDRGRVRIGFDLSLNCPEADTAMVLVGAPALGFHSGANTWAETVMWNDSNAMNAVNNGSDIFTVTIDVMDYYGIEYDSLQNIQMVMNNGVADTAMAWAATGRDERDGGFGGDQPCSDLFLLISEAPTCDLTTPDDLETSNSLLSDAAGSCMDRNFGLVKIGFDLSLNCAEADTANVLSGMERLGFHSGANNWSSIVNWDADGSKPAVNDGNDVFSVVINPETYYSLPLDSINNIEFLLNNGFGNPDDPWSITGKDTGAGGFGGTDPCKNLLLVLDELPGCDLSETASSHAIFNGRAASCVDTTLGIIQIDFDLDLNCPEADTDGLLVDAPMLGFHSGVNEWMNQKAWDDAGAKPAVNDGSNLFSVAINVETYYGLPLDSIEAVNFLFNNGIAAPDAPWDNQAQDSRDNVGGFGASPCSNLLFMVSEAPVCDLATSVVDEVLVESLRVYPNPFNNEVMIEFDNPNSRSFELIITDINGKLVRRVADLTGTQTIVQRDGLPAGMYFAQLRDRQGYFATAKLMIQD